MKTLETRSGESNRETRSFSLEIKANEDGSIEGYGSVFDVVDDYDDVVASGAFTASLKAHKVAKTLPAMLWQHNSDYPIGVWLEMSEDARGLRVKGQLALDTVKGAEAYALLKMGALNGLSIGFISKKWEWDESTDIRTITELDLWEVSLVTFPSNSKARIDNVKSVDISGIKSIRQAEKALRDVGFSDDHAKALVAQVKRVTLDERDAREVALALKAANRLLESLSS